MKSYWSVFPICLLEILLSKLQETTGTAEMIQCGYSCHCSQEKDNMVGAFSWKLFYASLSGLYSLKYLISTSTSMFFWTTFILSFRKIFNIIKATLPITTKIWYVRFGIPDFFVGTKKFVKHREQLETAKFSQTFTLISFQFSRCECFVINKKSYYEREREAI